MIQKLKFSVKGTTFKEAAENIKMIYATLSRKKEKDGLSALPHFTVRLVPDTDNQYDPEWAIVR